MRPQSVNCGLRESSRAVKFIRTLPGKPMKGDRSVTIAPLSSLIDRLEAEQGPDAQLDVDLREYALAGRPDWPDHETPRLTARLDQAIALPSYLGLGWEPIMRKIGDVDKWRAAAELAKTGDESPFCRRFLIAVLRAAEEARS